MQTLQLGGWGGGGTVSPRCKPLLLCYIPLFWAYYTGFPTGVENTGSCALPHLGGGGSSSKFDGGRGLSQYMGRAWWGLKLLSKKTCKRVHLIGKLPAISLQACKFTKMNFFTHIFQGF